MILFIFFYIFIVLFLLGYTIYKLNNKVNSINFMISKEIKLLKNKKRKNSKK